MPEQESIGAVEAAAILGVSRQTLYAYVSRGLLGSEPGPGPSRARRYSRAQVERLKAGQRRGPPDARGAQRSLFWGLPVLDSALTLVAEGRLWYRGDDAVALATTSSFEEVAALLWTGDARHAKRVFPDRPPDRGRSVPTDLGTAFSEELVREAARSPLSIGAPREAVLGRAAHLVSRLFVRAGATGRGNLAERLAAGWGVADPRTLEAALVLCADHELNVSSFTARCVASADTRLEHALLAALCAMQGRRHGAAHRVVARLIDETARIGPAAALADAIDLTGGVAGFGHPLYPDGDPRARLVIELAAKTRPMAPAAAALVDAVASRLRVAPNLDFALVVVSRALGLPPDAPFALFTLGRTAGWVAHVLEARDDGRLVRPRARYVGEAPRRPSRRPDVRVS